VKINKTLCGIFFVLPLGLLLVSSIVGQNTRDTGASQALTIQKMDPRLRENTTPDATFTVFVVLKNQPHREIVEQITQAARSTMATAESRYMEASSQPFASQDLLKHARADFDAVLLRVRQQVGRDINAAIAPEQDAMEARLAGLGAINIQKYLAMNIIKADVPGSALSGLEADPSIVEVFPAKDGTEMDLSEQLAVLDVLLFNSAAMRYCLNSFGNETVGPVGRLMNQIETLYGATLSPPAWQVKWPALAVLPAGTCGDVKLSTPIQKVQHVKELTPDDVDKAQKLIRSLIEDDLNARCRVDCRDQDNCSDKKKCVPKAKVMVANDDLDFSQGTNKAACGTPGKGKGGAPPPCVIGSYPKKVNGVGQPLTCPCECKE
jgi:hypothetical protein